MYNSLKQNINITVLCQFLLLNANALNRIYEI